MSVINTNISATIATNAMARNERQMSTAMERLSTGLRINSAKDDAAGLAISSRMKAVVSGLTMASKNANDAISMLEVAEGATLEISNMLIRMRELAVQSASGTYSDSDRDALDLEFGALMSEMDRIAKNTTWNTMSILNGGNDAADATVTKSVLDIQLGADASQKMELSLKAWVPSVAVDMQALNADGYDVAGGKSIAGAAKADGLDTRNATEKTTVTFTALASGEFVDLGGLKLLAGAGGISLADVQTAFASRAVGFDGTGVSITNGTWSGKLAGFTTGSVDAKSGAVTFTSVEAFKDVTDLPGTATSTIAKSVVTQGVAAADASTAQANESAYGDAVLYWNDNGTAKAINIDTVANSEFAIDQLDKAILGVATERAKYGAYMSRLEHSSDNLLNVAQNTDQSRSRIEDADYAVETSELARTQIISQASTAMLAQANQSKQSVLSLLQG
ncbi:flagellin [Gammaproteobacteria bacterium]|nr:flagellin [Gammaproteobacteria bacterium]